MLTSNPSSAIENVATETWSECLSHMDLTVQRNMMQTCKFFREMCLPLVFKKECVLLHVDPCIPNQEQDLRPLMHSLALSKSSVHAPLVRKLTLSYNEDNFRAGEPTVADVKYLRSMFTNLCVKLFPRFTNLREVYIVSNRNIDKALLVALAELPNLTELGMGSVKFGMLDLSNGTRIRVRKLGIFNNVSDYDSKKAATVLDVFSGERLEDLTILSRVYSPKIMRSLTQQNNNALLKSIRLELDPKELKTLVDFLVSTQNLESLHVSLVKSSSRLRNSSVSVPKVLPRLPSSALPQLRSFSGVEELAKMIVPGRPVQHINVEARCRLWHSGKNNILDRRPEELNMLLARLAASIVPIKHLGLEDYVLENGLLDTIACHAPNISSVLLNLKQEIDMVGDSPDKSFISKDEVYFDDTIKHSQNLADQQSRFFLPSVQHLPYMTLMYSIAVRVIHLPANLKEISLLHPHFGNGWEHIRMMFNHVVLEEVQRQNLLNTEAKDERVYTFTMAKSIFNAVSCIYPSLREVKLMSSPEPEHIHFSWYRDERGVWDLREVNGLSRYSYDDYYGI